jgi:hypothetical protein
MGWVCFEATGRPSVCVTIAPPIWRLILIAQKLIDFARTAVIRCDQAD